METQYITKISLITIPNRNWSKKLGDYNSTLTTLFKWSGGQERDYSPSFFSHKDTKEEKITKKRRGFLLSI
jgi:hypothetical protein